MSTLPIFTPVRETKGPEGFFFPYVYLYMVHNLVEMIESCQKLQKLLDQYDFYVSAGGWMPWEQRQPVLQSLQDLFGMGESIVLMHFFPFFYES